MGESYDVKTLLAAQVLTLAELLRQQDEAKKATGTHAVLVDYVQKAALLITSQRERVLAAVAEKG